MGTLKHQPAVGASKVSVLQCWELWDCLSKLETVEKKGQAVLHGLGSTKATGRHPLFLVAQDLQKSQDSLGITEHLHQEV